MQISRTVLLVAGLSLPLGHASSRCGSALRRLEGWTILKATSVSGSFEGCNFGKKIEFIDGTKLTCATYSYNYSYAPDAIIFGKSATFQGKNVLDIKVLIDDELYDMYPIIGS